MKKIAAAVLAVMMVWSLAACAGAEEKTEVREQAQTEAAAPDAVWNVPETIEMPEDVIAVNQCRIKMPGRSGHGCPQ